MPKWPIRVKLIARLSLVVGMMLTLMGGAIFGLIAFHDSNLMHTDLLREFGASEQLINQVFRLEAPRDGKLEEKQSLQSADRATHQGEHHPDDQAETGDQFDADGPLGHGG